MYTPRRSEILWPYSLVEEESSRKFYASSPCRAKPGKLPQRVARDAALNPDGEWNEYEIRVETDRIIVFLNGVKINEWVDDPNIDLARIGIVQRAVGTPLSKVESAGDARYMHGADGRNRYND